MKIKKYIASGLVFGMILTCQAKLAFADTLKDEQKNNYDIIKQQEDGFDKIDKQIKANGLEFSDKDKNTNGGTYPRRIGAVLVTSDGSLGKLLGHAGIVHTAKTTVESFPDGGVKVYNNNWDTRYKKVYGLGVRNTSTTQDKEVAEWCYNKRTLPYNWNFFNIDTLSKFYCSQLVYKGFRSNTGVNLNYGGGIVFPYDLVKTGNTYTSYTKGI